MANDLSHFRENWLKEIGQHEYDKYEEDEIEKAGTSAELPPSRSEKIENKPNKDHCRVSDQPLPAHVDVVYNKIEVKEEQGVVHAENDIKWHNINNIIGRVSPINESSATYYPFRILSTLLNRASTEERPRSARRSRGSANLSQHGKQEKPVMSKRNYFLTTDCGCENAEVDISKRVRTDVLNVGKEKKGYLDMFIADLDEISEIPFFDINLPREVAINIFQHLSIIDLCHCAQVSKSWCSLAEDELLWCKVCHSLGFEKETVTIEHENWKARVRHYTVIKRTLELNWKNRTGKLHNLHFAKGGVLCAVHVNSSTIVAGYSNCQTKLWDVLSGETCIFQPSSTALIIDEAVEEGMIDNEVVHVATCNRVTAASYSHGFVDVWSNEEGTEPRYSFQLDGRGRLCQPSSLQLMEIQQAVYLAVSHNRTVKIHRLSGCEGRLKDTAIFDSTVKSTSWLQSADKAIVAESPNLIVATNYTVNLMAVNERELGCPYSLLELHNIVVAPVTCTDSRLHPAEVVVGYKLNTGPSQFFKVNIYDIISLQTKYTLSGHTACVLCVNMAESPPHQFVSGSEDRKVRVYDTRYPPFSVMTFIGHSAAVTTVQMDDGKVVSGDEAGFVCVWDQRMSSKLWEMNNRHPVRYCHFSDRQLVVGHVPYVKHHPQLYQYDTGLHQRHRGSLHVYDFLADQTRQGVPEICLSSYDEPQGYNYNISLAVPYDQL